MKSADKRDTKRRRSHRGGTATKSARPDSTKNKSAERKCPERKCPERKCIVSGDTLPTDSMIRFVLSPDRVIVPDLKHKLEGRGVWVTASRSCVERAVKQGLFARGFRTAIRGPDDLADLVQRLLENSCLNALGLARKAGNVILGQAKVEAAARRNALGVVLHAGDGSPDGRRKIQNALLAGLAGGKSGNIEVLTGFTSNQLSLALGMSNVIHAAMPSGGIADAFAKNCRRLMRYREIEMPDPLAGQAESRKKKPDNLIEFLSEEARSE